MICSNIWMFYTEFCSNRILQLKIVCRVWQGHWSSWSTKLKHEKKKKTRNPDTEQVFQCNKWRELAWGESQPTPAPAPIARFRRFLRRRRDHKEGSASNVTATSFFQTSPRLFQLAPYVKCHQIKRARKKSKNVFRIYWILKIMIEFCYWRLWLGIDVVSCRLL